MTPEKIRELIGKLRWLEKDTRDDLAAKRCNEAADALEHLLQFVEWKPIESAPKDAWVMAFYPRETEDKINGRYEDQWAVAKWFPNIGEYGSQGAWLDAAEHREFEQPTHWLALFAPAPSHREEK